MHLQIAADIQKGDKGASEAALPLPDINDMPDLYTKVWQYAMRRD